MHPKLPALACMSWRLSSLQRPIGQARAQLLIIAWRLPVAGAERLHVAQSSPRTDQGASARTSTLVGPRLVLLGDAAHAVQACARLARPCCSAGTRLVYLAGPPDHKRATPWRVCTATIWSSGLCCSAAPRTAEQPHAWLTCPCAQPTLGQGCQSGLEDGLLLAEVGMHAYMHGWVAVRPLNSCKGRLLMVSLCAC